MKRAGLILIAVVLAAVLTAPIGVGLSRGGWSVREYVASAATDPLAGENGAVCVAVPILANASNQGACQAGEEQIDNDKAGGAIIFYLKLVLILLNGLVGGVIVLVLVIAGIQYIISGGDPANIKKAKGRIMNAVTALILYLLMFAILNFLIPGGIL